MAQDLKAFIEEHQIKQPHILGHSMGGKTAMEFAVNHSGNLQKLVVVDIAPVKYEVHHYDIIDALESLDLSTIDGRKEADEQLSLKIKETGIRQFLLKNLYWKSKGELAWRFNLAVLKKEILPISEWNIPNGKFEDKVLFVKGANSNYILPQYAVEIESRFPDYQLEEIANAGHWVHAEAPKQFSEVVLAFLKN